MTVVVASRGYPSEKYPLNGIFEYDQAKALAAAGHRVIFAAADLRSLRRWRRWGRQSLRADGMAIETMDFPGGRLPERWMDWLYLRSFKRLYRAIRKKYGVPDIVHAHFPVISYAAVRCFLPLEIPVVVTEHYSDIIEHKLTPVQRRKMSFAYSRAAQVIAVSRPLADAILSDFSAAAEVVPNIVDTGIFQYTPAAGKSPFVFCVTGNLKKSKRIGLAIRAFALLDRRRQPCQLRIFGDGPEREALRGLVKELRIEDAVTFYGRCLREELAEQYTGAHCFILLSAFETFGVVYIEAMAAGLPVIATRCGGPEDFVEPENGMLLPADCTAADAAAAMADMMDRYEQYDRQRIAEKTAERFSPENVAGLITEIYKKVLGK
ncbi:MAG: glycosyltransferase [Oscillospiraceae bacterium]|nr:glycosyltransferase [Oscillospiraceae bacterium]